jgi:hypothetical protein
MNFTQEQRKNPHSKRKEAASMKENGYAGSIKNGGTQVVKAPAQSVDPKKGTVKTGSDLRSGKK